MVILLALFSILITISVEAKKSTKSSKGENSKPKEFAKVNEEAEKLSLPPNDQIAAELKINPKEFAQEVENFSQSLFQGSKSKVFKNFCNKQINACTLLTSYFAQQEQARFISRREKKPGKLKPFKITAQQAQNAQLMPYLNLVQRLVLKDEQEFVSLANEAFKTQTCPRNLSAALTIRVEEYFPSSTSRTLAKQLFEHAQKCLDQDDPAYERVYLRQALYALYDGNRERAEQILNATKNATISAERYRVFYWLGKIAQGKGVKPEKNEAWANLIAQFPLSFYSILASVEMGRDPMIAVTNHKVGGVSRSSKANPDLNDSIRWLEALYSFKKLPAVAKWAAWIVKDTDDLEVEVLQYISAIKIASGHYRSNIATLFNYFRSHPSELNAEGLRLLYPRPYFDIVSEASKDKIDPFLVFGLMRQESAFDSGAVSRVKAKGLMQIIPQTARRLASNGHKKLFNEKDNTVMGVKYLVHMAERFEGKMELVLAGYNAGPNKVEEWQKRNPDQSDPVLWNDLIPYMETRDYVVSILRNNYFYIRLYGGSGDLSRSLASSNRVYSSSIVTQLLTTKP